MLPDAPDRIIATLSKNSREDCQIALRSFKGARSIDLRIYVKDHVGEPRPTAKGLSIKPALLRDVIASLQEAERVAIAEGLLPPS